jgi:hypothetical protein
MTSLQEKRSNSVSHRTPVKRLGKKGKRDEPLRLLDSVSIGLRVPQALDVDLVGLGNLVSRSVSDEDGLSSPLDDDVLALRNGRHRDLNLGEGEDISRGREGADEVDDDGLGGGGGEDTHRADHEVGEVSVGAGRGGSVLGEVRGGDGVSRGGRGSVKGSSAGVGSSWKSEMYVVVSSGPLRT